MLPFKSIGRLMPLLLSPLLLMACSDEAPQPISAADTTARLKATPDFNGANAYIHCEALCSLGPRPTGSAAYTAQLAYLTAHLQQSGWMVTQQTFSLSNGARMVNLHATFGTPGTTRPIILTCHIDTKQGVGKNFVGADDGASAAAAMLELARVLKTTPQQAQAVELIFFDGEESYAPRMSETDGLYGSRYDVMRRGDVKLPRYQINLDMVGGRNKTIAIPLPDTDADMLAMYEQVITELGISPERWVGHSGSYLDDHQPYVRAGVKSINLIADFQRGGWWHTERDNMERICPQSLQETGRVVLALLNKMVAAL